jgi:integrase/recombinase XerD
MTTLRQQLIRELQLRRYSQSTQAHYVSAVRGLAAYYHIAPDQLSAQQVQDYVLYLMRERHLTWNAVNTIVSGLKFFYTHTLKRSDISLSIPCRRTPRPLPEVLSALELQRLFAAAPTGRDRALLMTTYAAGLRIGEVVRLQIPDLDSQRGLIRVRGGKGDKDRYSLFSPRLVQELRAYWQKARPPLVALSRPPTPATPVGVSGPPPLQAGQTSSRHSQRRQRPRPPPQLRHPLAGSRRQPPHHSEPLGTQLHPHHRTLCPCPAAHP